MRLILTTILFSMAHKILGVQTHKNRCANELFHLHLCGVVWQHEREEETHFLAMSAPQ